MASTFLNDMANDTQLSYSVAPQTISSATTVNGTAVDMLNTDGPCYLLWTTGNCGDGSTVITLFLTESDTSAGTYTAVPTCGPATGTVDLAASATANDNTAGFVKGIRTKRFLKANITTLGGTPSVIISAAILARLKVSGSGGGYQS